MANFYVGQRVRIVAALLSDVERYSGHEGIILSPCDVYPNAYDVSGATTTPDGRPLSWDGDHLRPILPEGHRPAELTVEELLPWLVTESITYNGIG